MRLSEVIQDNILPEYELKITVLVGVVQKKSASKLMSLLGEKHSLQSYGLTHLRRARSNKQSDTLEVIISPITVPLENIDVNVRDMLISTHSLETYRVEPRNKEQWQKWSLVWPMHFRPSNLDRERERGCTIEEYNKSMKYMIIAENDEAKYSDKERQQSPRGGIVVNPENGKIIMTSRRAYEQLTDTYGTDIIARHPLYSPAMLCIHGVAEVILGNLQQIEYNSMPNEPYLCTGLHFYLVHEPDLVSSMGIVHSRISRLIFRHVDEEHGALATHYHLHDMRALNHRFRVFQLLEI
jgi:tRNA-specific adenosine deaminase 3